MSGDFRRHPANRYIGALAIHSLNPQNTANAGAAGEVEEFEENRFDSQTRSGAAAVERSFGYPQEMCTV